MSIEQILAVVWMSAMAAYIVIARYLP